MIIEREYERSNLGVKTAEIVLESNKIDDSELEAAILNYEYLVCKISSGNMELVYGLQDRGFTFAESLVDLCADLRTLRLPSIYERYVDSISYERVYDIDRICDYIRKGLFQTDRISLDAHFSLTQSAERYVNWLKSSVNDGSTVCYETKANNEAIGFFSIKEISEKKSYSLLASLYNASAYIGLGFSVLYFPMLQSKIDGKSKIVTNVSSNNMNSLKLHLELGYSLKNIEYVFIKHNKLEDV